jgi:hypothetical protein
MVVGTVVVGTAMRVAMQAVVEAPVERTQDNAAALWRAAVAEPQQLEVPAVADPAAAVVAFPAAVAADRAAVVVAADRAAVVVAADRTVVVVAADRTVVVAVTAKRRSRENNERWSLHAPPLASETPPSEGARRAIFRFFSIAVSVC